ncbi:hypothetical protein XL16_21795 [Salmonella enterica subsp. enterica serovar Gaminara]|nr:hypothetical protein [Salmonella enterica subsp. enterica serovar Gaminara]
MRLAISKKTLIDCSRMFQTLCPILLQRVFRLMQAGKAVPDTFFVLAAQCFNGFPVLAELKHFFYNIRLLHLIQMCINHQMALNRY